MSTAGPWDDYRPTGELHDGDTFRLSDGRNARLYGVDAFELNQQGRSPTGALVPLGREARGALAPFATPTGTFSPTGGVTYGRPVGVLNNGGDAGRALLDQGLGLTVPRYLSNDPNRFFDYSQAERLARLNRRGAFAGSFQTPESYRRGNPDPWKAPEAGTEGNSTAVFWDDPTPSQGLKPEVEQGYLSIWQDLRSKPDDLIAYANRNGFRVDPDTVRAQYAKRDRDQKAGGEVEYAAAPPRVLTDLGDGAPGSFIRGVGDPINILDEAGAIADTLLPGADRETLWSSDRRFGDVYANNLYQNRSILDADEANHPWARFGGQLASGVVVPGASVEGLGFSTARAALRGGASRFAAEQAARRAVVGRLATAGSIEGGLAGAGAGETTRDRIVGGVIGAPIGGALGVGAGVLAPKVASLVGRPFSRLTGRAGERTAEDFSDGAVDTAKALAGDDLAPARSNVAGRPLGQFGPIHDDADYPTALTRMVQDQAGEMPGAIRHPQIGPVDLIWGTDKYGLQHIARRHAEVLDDLPAIVERLPVRATPDDTPNGHFVLEDDAHRAILAPDFDGQAKRWVVTAYERKTPGAQDTRRAPLNSPGGGSPGDGAAVDISSAGLSGNDPYAALGRPIAMDAEGATPTLRGPWDDYAPDRIADRIDVNQPRPMLADAPDAERLNAAGRLQPRDVLALPSNTVDGIEEAAGIERGRYAPVRAGDEADALTRRNIPNANTGTPIAKRGPLDLVSWLRSQGGIRAQGGELEHAGIDNGARKGVDFAGGEQRLGPLVSNAGMTYDDAAYAAWEAGYFPELAERPTISEFLDAVVETHRGGARRFHPDDLGEVEAFERARSNRYDVEGARERGEPYSTDRAHPATLADLDANAPPVRAYEEWGENAPDLAGNIRLDKLDSPQAIKRALVQTERLTGGFDAARRGRITQAETKALANDLGMTADDLLSRRKGQAFNAEEALAARQILARSATDLVNMAKGLARVDNPGDEVEAAFRQAWVRHAAIQEQVAGMTAEAGRALAQFRQLADSRDTGRVLSSLGEALGGPGRMKEVAERIVDLEQAGTTPAGINRFALRSLLPRWKDKAAELYINSLLSGPQTHAVNILSNTLTAIAQLPEHAAAAGIGAARRLLPGQAETERVLFSELGTRGVGLLAGAREGMRLAARSFISGDALDGVTKAEYQPAIGGKLGSVIRTPTRLLTAEDELFKGMARRMELNGLAMRRAKSEGLSGKAARDRAAELVANPSDAMLARSFDYARYLTFQTPLPSNSIAAQLSRKGQDNLLLKVLVPFVRTPMNLLKFAAERSPAAVLMKSWRKEVMAGGARRDLALARAMVGTGVAASMYEMAQAGHITGGGPADLRLRQTMMANGWQPYSLKVGDRYYSYARLDPFSTTIGTVADMVDLSSGLSEDEQAEGVMLVTAAIMNNLSSKTWLSGLSSALEAVNDPGRYLDNFVARTAGAIAVPSIVASAARASDPILREARGPLDRIRSRVPGLSDNLMPRRDVLGQEVPASTGLGPDVLSPVWTSDARNDPALSALTASRIGLTKPQRTYVEGGKRKEWSGPDYDRLQQLVGSIAKPRLDDLVSGPAWKGMDQDAREESVRKLMTKARKEAKRGMFGRGVPAAPVATSGPWNDARGSGPWNDY